MTRINPRPNVERLRASPPGGASIYQEMQRLMPRDRWLITLLGKHQVFTTEQITALAFDSQHTARNRMLQLRERGILARFRDAVRPGSASWRWTLDLLGAVFLLQLRERGILARFRDAVRPGSASWRWTLDLLGAAFLAAQADQPPPRLAAVSNRIDRLSASPRLAHLLGINDLFVELIAHSRTHPATELRRWWPERECRQVTGDLVRPDGHGVWGEHGTAVSFWLEHDMGTEKTHAVTEKLSGYDALIRETKRRDVVLFRVISPRAEASLHTHLAKHPAVRGGRLLVATSVHDTHPAAPVWQPAAQTSRHRLADLSALLTDRP